MSLCYLLQPQSMHAHNCSETAKCSGWYRGKCVKLCFILCFRVICLCVCVVCLSAGYLKKLLKNFDEIYSYSLFICRHPFSTTYIFFSKNHQSLISYASPHLWNQLPVSFRQPCIKHPADDVTLSNSPPTCSPLSPSIHVLFQLWFFSFYFYFS